MNKTPIFKRVAIVGIGLIGSSLSRAIKANQLAAHVAVHDISIDALETAEKLSIADSYHENISDAVLESDLIVLAIPIRVYRETVSSMVSSLSSGAILTDVGSVKEEVIRVVKPILPIDMHLVPGHPVAGTEHSGPESGFSELFQDRWTILTPETGTNKNAVEIVKEMWQRVGSDVEIMGASHHDRVLAITSHLPHLIAYTIVATAADVEGQLKNEKADEKTVTTAEVIKYSAGGFRDFTRIAGSDPVMWRDVFLSNKEAVLEMLGRFTEDLTALQRAIRWEDGDQLEALFKRTRSIRRSVVEAGQAGGFQYTEVSADKPKK
jgi:cyclohexadieny/prephenate dehydrogenase